MVTDPQVTHESQEKRKMVAENDEYLKDICIWCHEPIKIQIFKGSGHCSDDHRKMIVAARANEEDARLGVGSDTKESISE